MEKQIFDNFLDPQCFKELQSVLCGSNFPWYYSSVVVNGRDGIDHFMFTHSFYREWEYCPSSDHYFLLDPFLRKINPYGIIRIKANLLSRTEKHVEHGFHTDVCKSRQKSIKTAIFYVNTNNGYTKFEDGDIIESIENRLVVFDSGINHTGSTCTDKKTRIVINFNYYP